MKFAVNSKTMEFGIKEKVIKLLIFNFSQLIVSLLLLIIFLCLIQLLIDALILLVMFYSFVLS